MRQQTWMFRNRSQGTASHSRQTDRGPRSAAPVRGDASARGTCTAAPAESADRCKMPKNTTRMTDLLGTVTAIRVYEGSQCRFSNPEQNAERGRPRPASGVGGWGKAQRGPVARAAMRMLWPRPEG